MSHNKPFWKSKALHELNENEWESICCRCGICCLHRFYNRRETYIAPVACGNLDLETCNCKTYESRFHIDRGCKKITPENLSELGWLPKTCGYRTLYEKREFEWWHPLVSESVDTVHQAGISIKDKGVISEDDLVPGEMLKYMLLSYRKWHSSHFA